jgi:SAM-dependent methyltransferase
MNLSLSRNLVRPDPRVLRAGGPDARGQGMWMRGNYAVAGAMLQLVSEDLCDRLQLREEQRVLDVAFGGCHAAVAAARRWCSVSVADAIPRRPGCTERAEAVSMGARFHEADAGALPFADQAFDAVLSVFGAMFAEDQERAASEMIRVCRRGRRIGLANWTPDGFMGQLFEHVARDLPGVSSGLAPFLWGTPDRLDELFGIYGTVECRTRHVVLRARSAAAWVDDLMGMQRPAAARLAAGDVQKQKALRSRLLELATRHNVASDGSLRVHAEYLEAEVLRR